MVDTGYASGVKIVAGKGIATGSAFPNTQTLALRGIKMQEPFQRQLRSPTTRGIHHLALCTDDMNATIDFYVEVLGMPLVHAMKVPAGLGTGPGNRGNPPYEQVRHYFFDMGNDSLLAFFEIPKGKEPTGNRNAIGAMQHCAFVVTAERFREVETRLKSNGIDYIGPIAQLPGLLGICFFDPNGVRLEFACQPEDGETPAVIPCITQTTAEARAELETLPGVTAEWIEERLAAFPGCD
jgi:catechol 2,3-dioxygenase-like lactoylglutathione lyase family enzyme